MTIRLSGTRGVPVCTIEGCSYDHLEPKKYLFIRLKDVHTIVYPGASIHKGVQVKGFYTTIMYPGVHTSNGQVT